MIILLTILFCIIVALAMNFAGALFTGWLLMLLLGVLHGSFWSSCVHPGYWPCVVVMFIFSLVFGHKKNTQAIGAGVKVASK